MYQVHFTLPDGRRVSCDAAEGESVMRVALDNGIDGIEGVCGGVAACGTCHVRVGEGWFGMLPPMDELEDIMLEEAEEERGPTSRLACQIALTPALDGLEVSVAAG